MNLIEAIKSGRKFRPPSRFGEYYYTDNIRGISLNHEMILADDWEVEGQTVTLNMRTLDRAIEEIYGPGMSSIEYVECRDNLMRKLGFDIRS